MPASGGVVPPWLPRPSAGGPTSGAARDVGCAVAAAGQRLFYAIGVASARRGFCTRITRRGGLARAFGGTRHWHHAQRQQPNIAAATVATALSVSLLQQQPPLHRIPQAPLDIM
jgi:hypothetical protein